MSKLEEALSKLPSPLALSHPATARIATETAEAGTRKELLSVGMTERISELEFENRFLREWLHGECSITDADIDEYLRQAKNR